MNGKKRIVSVTLEKPQSDFLDSIFETYGTKATDLFRSLLQKRMEEEEERQRPQIVYYGSGGSFTPRISTDYPISSSVATGKKTQEIASMIGTNSEMKALIEQTDGNPRRALKKVIREDRQVKSGR